MSEAFLERKNRQAKEWRARNPKHADGLWKTRQEERWAADPVRMFYSSLKSRAKRKGYDFLSLAELRKVMAPMRCSRTGKALSWNRYKSGFHSPWAPSIDRIDNSGGYELDNVQLVCWLYNSAKGQFTDEHVMEMARCLLSQAK